VAVVLTLLLILLSCVTSYAATGAPAPPLFTGGTGSAATYYVTPGGPVGGGEACSLGDPCGLQEGIDRAQANETVILLDGTYNNEELQTTRSGTAGNHIIFRAQNKGLAKIDTNDQEPVQIDHNYITFDGLWVSDKANGDEADAAFRFDFQGGIHHIIIENCTTFHTGDVAIRATGNSAEDHDIIIRFNLFDGCGYNTDIENPPSNNIDGECIYMGQGGGGPGVDDVMIYGNEIRDWTSNAIDLKPSVTNAWMYDNIIHSSANFQDHGTQPVVEDGAIHLIGENMYFYNNKIFNLKDSNRVFRTRTPNGSTHMYYNNVVYDAPDINTLFEADSGNGTGWLFNNTFWDLASYAVDDGGYNLNVEANLGVGTGDGLTIGQMNANWFLNAAAGQFQLTDNATLAIDAADTDPFSALDHDGTAINGADRDVGAYEFSGAITMAALQAAINAAAPGTVITVADNTYNNPGEIVIDHGDDCTQVAPCTIMAETTGQWIITGNTSGFKIHGDWWTIKGFVVQNQTGHLNSGWMEMYSAQNVVVEDCRFTGMSGGWDFAFTFGNEPDVEQGLNITVQDCEFDNWTGADNWIFDWNVRSNNHIHTGLNWLRNHMHDLNFDAGSNLGANNLGNFVGRAGTLCNGLFQDNIWERISADNPQDNCFFHPKCSALTFKNEIFRDSPECAIRLRQGYGNVLDGNLFENLDIDFNTAQVWISGGNHRIVNNVFNPQGGTKKCLELTEGCILASATDAECSTEADPDNDCHYIASSGTIVANNTFVGCDTESIDLNEAASSNQCDPVNVCPADNFLENNILYHNNGGVAIRDAGCTQQTVDDNLFHLTGGATAGLQGTRADFDDPEFIDVGADNFNLSGTSPAIDAGHNVTGTTLDALDILGIARPQGGEYDFGAYEFDGADTLPPCVPTNLVATPVSSTQIDLTWGICTEPDLQDYIIQRCVGVGCSNFATIATWITQPYPDTGLAAGQTHRYQIASRDTSQNISGFSAIAEATTFSASANSGTFYVVQATGLDSRTCDEIKVLSTPALTIGYALSCAEGDADGAGDQVLVGNGTYNERVLFGAHGGSGNPYVLGNITGTSPIVDGNGVTVPQFAALVQIGVWDYITVQGLTVINSDFNGILVHTAHHSIIQNNVVDAAGTNCITLWNIVDQADSKVLNNEVKNCGQSGILLLDNDGGYFLIEGNLVHNTTGTNNFDAIQGGDTHHIIVQGNTIHSIGVAGDYLDMGGDAGEVPTLTHHIVVRDNVIYKGGGTIVPGLTGVKLNNRATRAIYARNLIDGPRLEFYEQPHSEVAIVHNTVINQDDHSLQFWNASAAGPWADDLLKNNIFGFSTLALLQHIPNSEDGSFGSISMTGNLYRFNTGGGQGIEWCLTGGCADYTPGTLANYNAWRTASGQEPNGGIHSTQSLAQLFVDSANQDVTPAAGSDSIDAGEHLTTAVGNGSGVQIQVVDSRYFIDGWGLVPGDQIQVGSNPLVRVTAVNEGTHTLTVDTVITWNNGDPVNYPYNGLSPDVGAVESGGVIIPKGVIIQPGTFNGGTFK